MKLDFRDGSEQFNELELAYAEYKLSGVDLSNSELDAKFGPALQALSNNLVLRKWIADQKIARKSKKALLDQMHIEKLVKLMPMAIKTLVEAMQSDNSADKRWAASLILKPGLAQLEKMSVNAADLEFDFDDNGNVIKIDAADKSVL